MPYLREKTVAKTTEQVEKSVKAEKNPKKRGFFRGVASTFFDVPRWVNAKEYVDTNKALYSKVKDTFRIAKAERNETFEEAMQRLKLSDQDLQERLAANQRALTIMLVFIGLMCVYGIYLIWSGAVAGTIMALAVIGLASVRAFQYSFWNFQIKNRALGCSFGSWLKGKS